MKNVLRKNIRTLLVVFIVMFAGLIVYLGYVVFMYGERWFVTPYNPRIQNMKTTIEAGDILDRDGRRLLYTEDGERKYIDNKDRRVSVAHIIGDGYGLTYGAQTFYAKYLFGFDKGSIERISDLLSGQERKGSDITLTIDAKLSAKAMEALGGSDGAVVIMNYETGEILASVSSPSFDPTDMSLFLEGGGESELVNRAFTGLYPPGSIFKIITAAALLNNDMADFETECEGSTEIDGQIITCWGEHGDIDLEGAIEHSCNVYFAEASIVLGARAIEAEANRFLFNQELLFDDVVMGESVFETANNDVDGAWAAIGQYHDLITPLHACMIAGSIANDGVMMEPKLLLQVSDGSRTTYELSPRVAARPMDDTDKLKEMMISVVQSGTGTGAAIDGYVVGGKTGTAEIFGEEENAAHAWFIGFVDDADHPLAIAVIMEKAGSGGANAAPAARMVLKKAIDLGY